VVSGQALRDREVLRREQDKEKKIQIKEKQREERR